MTARGAPSDRMDALNEILARNELRFDLAALGMELKGLEQELERERKSEAQDRTRTPGTGQGADASASDDAQHRALLAAWSARRRHQSMTHIGRYQSVAVGPPPPMPKRASPPRPGAQLAPDERQAEQNRAPQTPPAQEQAQPTPPRVATQESKPGTDKPAAETTKSQQPSGEWTIGKSWVQDPQGQHMPYVSPEHIAASQRAAEQAQAAARLAGLKPAADLGKEAQDIRKRARAEQRHDAQASRAASQETSRPRADANTSDNRFHQTTRAADVPQQPSWRAPNVAQAGRAAAHTGLRVFNRATGIVSSLGSFVDSLLASTPREPKPEKIDFHTLMNDPDAARRYDEQHLAEAQRRNLHPDVLDDIKRDIEAGRDLKAEDISKLPREHLEQIKAKGDAYVLQLAASARDWSEKYWGGGNDWSGGWARGRERERE
jgi:hypothetical protein